MIQQARKRNLGKMVAPFLVFAMCSIAIKGNAGPRGGTYQPFQCEIETSKYDLTKTDKAVYFRELQTVEYGGDGGGFPATKHSLNLGFGFRADIQDTYDGGQEISISNEKLGFYIRSIHFLPKFKDERKFKLDVTFQGINYEFSMLCK